MLIFINHQPSPHRVEEDSHIAIAPTAKAGTRSVSSPSAPPTPYPDLPSLRSAHYYLLPIKHLVHVFTHSTFVNFDRQGKVRIERQSFPLCAIVPPSFASNTPSPHHYNRIISVRDDIQAHRGEYRLHPSSCR